MTSTEPLITPELMGLARPRAREYERILKLIGRAPSFTELGIFSAMWNEHCSYNPRKSICARCRPMRR
jgi:phosphoribosylformylglycinamidine synthase